MELWGRAILYAGWEAAKAFRQVNKEAKEFIDSQGDDFYAKMWICCGYHDEFYPVDAPSYTEMKSDWKVGDFWFSGNYREVKKGDDLIDREHISEWTNRDITGNFINASLLYNGREFPPAQPKQWQSWRDKNKWRDTRKTCRNETCKLLIPPPLSVASFPVSDVRVDAAGQTIDDKMVLVEAGSPEKRLIGLVKDLVLAGDFCFFCCRPGHWVGTSGGTQPIHCNKILSIIDVGN